MSCRKNTTNLIISLVIITFLSLSIASAADAAYIYKNKLAVDKNIVNLLKEKGFTVDLISEKSIPSNLSKYELVFIGDERFKNPSKIPIGVRPTIITNYYDTDTFGLNDADEAGRYVASSPLMLSLNRTLVQAYTKGMDIFRVGVPYYYLPNNNKAPAMQKIAGTAAGLEQCINNTPPQLEPSKLGDVISYASAGSELLNGNVLQNNLCYYGIAKSKYWTNESKKLFLDCITYVSSVCTTDAQCQQIVLDDPYCHNGDLYKDTTSFMCNNPGTMNAFCSSSKTKVLIEECSFGCANAECIKGIHDVSIVKVPNTDLKIRIQELNGSDATTLICGETYKYTTAVKNNGNFSENVKLILEGSINFGEFTLNPAETKTNTGDVELFDDIEGTYEIIIDAIINDDSNLNDNTAKRTIEIICPQPLCFTDTDCGIDGYQGAPFCTQKNVTKNFIDHTCNNPGKRDSFCSSSTSQKTIEQCSDFCSNGQCQTITCHNNNECDDNNPLTIDQCINPNTTSSQCRNTEINCASNLDCGFTGFLGNEFCSQEDVYKNYQTATCNNAGTLLSSCTLSVNATLTAQCDYACTDATCIRCDENSDCKDNNNNTADTCIMPGTVQSYCQNNETKITCFENSDCGIDGFINSAYCSQNNITKDFKAYTCNNAGTPQSFCSNNISKITQEICDFECSNGQCITKVCGNGIKEGTEECDDGNTNNNDLCSNSCTTNHPGIPLDTCSEQGQGEIILYSAGNQFQPITKQFLAPYDQLVIFTRSDYLQTLVVKENSVTKSPAMIFSTTMPFPVKIYSLTVSPGSTIDVSGTSTNGARAIQGYLIQNSSAPAYDLSKLTVTYDSAKNSTVYLTNGSFSYVVFDKYSLLNPGQDDSRKLRIKVTGPTGTVHDQQYTKPFPTSTEGAVVNNFNAPVNGTYTLQVITEDSVYWPLFTCI